mgnify:FL=1
MKVGDLVTYADECDCVGIIVAPSMTGLWMVLIDNVVYQLLERRLEVISESR